MAVVDINLGGMLLLWAAIVKAQEHFSKPSTIRKLHFAEKQGLVDKESQ